MKPATLPYVDRGPTRSTRPWSDIAEHFRGVVGQEPMVALVQHVAAAPYADRLFGVTSIHILLVAQTAELYPTQEVVRVEYQDGRFLVTCQERGFTLDAPTDDAIARWVPVPDGIGAVERLLRAKRWM